MLLMSIFLFWQEKLNTVFYFAVFFEYLKKVT